VNALDWPGHGESDPIDNPTACGFAELLPRVLAELPGGPFVLGGNSIGGFAALRTAATRPELVRGLVLVSPGGFTPRWPGMLAVCTLIANQRVSAHAMGWLPRLYLRRRTMFTTAILERMDAASREPGAVTTFASLWRSFTDRDHDARADADRITVPTLLAWGRRDPILPWPIDGRRARAHLPNAEVATFACGHQPYAEVPQEFQGALSDFLDKHDLVASTE
jgi:pimeloyl-ACP methyl ester carboxylesterase